MHNNTKVWFITGAGRGLGIDTAQAALAAGHSVVATGRNADRVRAAVGEHENLFAVSLDVTDPDAATAATQAAVDRFGRIDVLVNNAGNFYAGYFENISPEQFRAQMETNFFGPLNVTRAVQPTLRAQRGGQVITVTSTAGLIGGEFTVAYAASKFALEGWMEALRVEVAPFGIHITVVNPGFFRTELLSEQSTRYAEPSVADYEERRTALLAAWKATHGRQAGDPAKLAQALLTIAGQEPPPRRFLAGADAIATAEQKIAELRTDIESNRPLSTSLAFNS
jgi:NAD(P)-dependent dehydrogenase (short-subunit alcohol dehydrogenase family)